MILNSHMGDEDGNWFTRAFESVSSEYGKIAEKRTADRAERRAREKMLKAELAARYPVASTFGALPPMLRNWQTWAVVGGVVLALMAFAPGGRRR